MAVHWNRKGQSRNEKLADLYFVEGGGKKRIWQAEDENTLRQQLDAKFGAGNYECHRIY